MMTTLEALRDELILIKDVATCKIGLEQAISPGDYPLIRIVVDRISKGAPYAERKAECTIFFGHPIADSEGLERVYEKLFELEAKILRQLQLRGDRYIDTVYDSDRLPTYKIAAIRCEIAG